MRNIFIILVVSVMFSCSESARDTGTATVNTASPETSAGSGDITVVIGPSDATVRSVISLRADGGILNNSDIQWYVNDNRDETAKGIRFISGRVRKGDVIHAVVVKDDKEYRSNEIAIVNTPPVITEARMLPTTPKLSSQLSVEVNAEDADHEVVGFSYKWFINDEYTGDESYLDMELKKGDRIEVEVTPFDKDGHGKSVRLKNSVFNTLPVFTESAPSFDGKTYSYQVQATDPDGDALAYALKENPEGMTIDKEKGIITWEVPPEDRDVHDVKISISDDKGGEVIVPITVKIQMQEEAADKEQAKK